MFKSYVIEGSINFENGNVSRTEIEKIMKNTILDETEYDYIDMVESTHKRTILKRVEN